MKLATLPRVLALTALTACAAGEGASSSSLTQEPGNCGSLETHVIGIYASATGAASVHVARPGKHALVLSAHEATRWTVTVAPGVEIEAIYATGVHRQTVSAPRGMRVVTEYKDAGDPYGCGYAYPTSGADCNTQNLLDLVKARVHEVTSFHGCYQAATWTIGEDLTVTSDCNTVGAAGQSDLVQGCDGEDSCGGPIIL